jgi:hypothetical protein
MLELQLLLVAKTSDRLPRCRSWLTLDPMQQLPHSQLEFNDHEVCVLVPHHIPHDRRHPLKTGVTPGAH